METYFSTPVNLKTGLECACARGLSG